MQDKIEIILMNRVTPKNSTHAFHNPGNLNHYAITDTWSKLKQYFTPVSNKQTYRVQYFKLRIELAK
jgi:hypothetical protein